MTTLDEALLHRPYPGRGCLAVATADGVLWFVYFLTGRSPASRSRDLHPVAGGAGELVAWRRHDYKPDPPICTPRSWMAQNASTPHVVAGWARRSNRGDGASEHGLLSIPALPPGVGVLLTTYDGTREEPRSSATPLDVSVTADSGEQLLEQVWGQLDPDLRVAAVAVRPGQSADTAFLTHS